MGPEHIAYFCPRVNLLKLYGPVMAEQVRRGNGLRALVIVPISPLISYAAKNRSLAAGLQLPQISTEIGPTVEVVCVESPGQFLDVLLERRVLAVVTVGLSLPRRIREGVVVPSRARSVRWCSLGYVYEELLPVLVDGAGVLDDWDVATTFSQAVVDRISEVLVARGVPGADRVGALHPIGFVECDQAAGFERRALRKKYGLAQDQPVIFFATAPTFQTLPGAMRGLFRRGWYRGSLLARAAGRLLGGRWPDMDYLAGYRDILSCLRRFADRNGGIILGKTRGKHKDPVYVGRATDQLLSDGSYYPFRTLELLHLADFYVGISSSTAFEAAFVGRRMRTIVPFPPEAYEDPVFLELKREFFYESPGLWNTPGFSELSRTYIARDWEAFLEWAEHGVLESRVDAAIRSALVERVIGFDDHKASARFLDLVETAIGRAGGRR